MAVPNNDTFNFEDVTNEIYGDTAAGRNLDDAHDTTSGTDADINLYDPEYIGDQNTLYNFRNYGGGTLNLTAASASVSCSDETLLYSVISSNTNTPPAINDNFVVDMGSGTTDTFVGGNSFYNYLYNGTFYSIRIDNSGVISQIPTPC